MVEFSTGAFKAHLGVTDMRIPIQYAFSTGRLARPRSRSRFAAMAASIWKPRSRDVPLPAFGAEALEARRHAPAVLNAANEVAVAAFLAAECGFLDIESAVAAVLDAHETEPLRSVETDRNRRRGFAPARCRMAPSAGELKARRLNPPPQPSPNSCRWGCYVGG